MHRHKEYKSLWSLSPLPSPLFSSPCPLVWGDILLQPDPFGLPLCPWHPSDYLEDAFLVGGQDVLGQPSTYVSPTLLRNSFFYKLICPLIVWTSDLLHQTHISNLFFPPSGLDRKNGFSLEQIHLFALIISIWISHQQKFLLLTCLRWRSLSQPFLSFFLSKEVRTPDHSFEFHIHSRFMERIPGVKMLSSP